MAGLLLGVTMKQFTIRLKADDVAEVLVYDVIGDDYFGGVSARTFRDQLKGVSARTLNLRINSPGGSVTEAAAMLAALDGYKGTVEVDVDGVAASAASVLMVAGKTVRIAADALVMIHDPRVVLNFGGAFTKEDLLDLSGKFLKDGDLLDKVKQNILDRYERKTDGKTDRGALAEMMAAETWFTAQEAVDAGLADAVTGATRLAACADLGKFRYRHAPTLQTPQASESDLEAHRRRVEIAASL